MISTYLNYRIYAADLPKTMDRQASLNQVTRDATYYRDNIGKVTSVDDFLKDQRLYAYAMKAYGLDDMTYAKGFMRKVLNSDLSDSQSFVNKLVDQRFQTFAKAFNFQAGGGLAKTEALAQDVAQESDTIGLYSERRVAQSANVTTQVKYFQTKIATVRSVDTLLSDSQLFDFALKSYGIDPSIASKTTIRSVLTSDLSDPGSFANQMTDDRYRALAAAFQFQPDGSVADGQLAQTSAQTTNTIYLNFDATDMAASPAAATFKSQYYQSKIAGITNVDDLLADDKLFEFFVTSFGLQPAYESKSKIRDVLTSDLSDQNSFANTQSTSYRQMAAAFNFKTDGTLDSGTPAQTAQQLTTTVDKFFENYDNAAAKLDKFQTDYYKISIGNITSVDQLLKNTKLFGIVLNAFGLDPSSESKFKISRVLTSDLADPVSFANSLHDKRYTALAAAFNFDKSGAAQVVRVSQTDDQKLATAKLYSTNIGDAKAQKTTTTDENGYYGETIDRVKTVDDLLSNKRLVSYVMTAYGFKDGEISNETLRKLLTSDLLDKTSFANKPENQKYRNLALAFNFATDGNARRSTANQAQDRDQIVKTADLYVRETVEQSAGDQNEGVRLALYFQRKASTVTTAYSILADKALLQVVRTALGLPQSMSQADIDVQANMINKKLNIADLKDPKTVEKLIARFATLYDIENGNSTTPSIATTLFATS